MKSKIVKERKKKVIDSDYSDNNPFSSIKKIKPETTSQDYTESDNSVHDNSDYTNDSFIDDKIDDLEE